jgi:hypothetical protein
VFDSRGMDQRLSVGVLAVLEDVLCVQIHGLRLAVFRHSQKDSYIV